MISTSRTKTDNLKNGDGALESITITMYQDNYFNLKMVNR